MILLHHQPTSRARKPPLQNLIDCLEAGDSLEDFLTSFPSVTRDQAIAALELAREALRAIDTQK